MPQLPLNEDQLVYVTGLMVAAQMWRDYSKLKLNKLEIAGLDRELAVVKLHEIAKTRQVLVDPTLSKVIEKELPEIRTLIKKGNFLNRERNGPDQSGECYFKSIFVNETTEEQAFIRKHGLHHVNVLQYNPGDENDGTALSITSDNVFRQIAMHFNQNGLLVFACIDGIEEPGLVEYNYKKPPLDSAVTNKLVLS